MGYIEKYYKADIARTYIPGWQEGLEKQRLPWRCTGPCSLHPGRWWPFQGVTLLSRGPQRYPRGTSGPTPPAPAGTVWRRSSVHAVKSHLAEDLFSFGDRGRAGAKDVLIKYPAIGAAGGSAQKLKLPWLDFSPFVHIGSQIFSFPRPRPFHFCFKEMALFLLLWGSAKSSMSPAPSPRASLPRGASSVAPGPPGPPPLSGLSAGVLSARAHTRTHAGTPRAPRACAHLPLRPMPRLHPSLSRPPVLKFAPPLAPRPPELSAWVSGARRSPFFA